MLIGALAGALALMAVPAAAQLETPTPDPEANITFPPPVYTLRGSVDIRGTANVPSQTNYFIEFRPVDPPVRPSDEAAADEDEVDADEEETTRPEPVFFPAVLPSDETVEDDVLGTWDTALVPDGLYELRMTVNTSTGNPRVVYVYPLRVENEPPPFVTVEAAVTQAPAASPTPAGPVPTATLSAAVVATIITENGNVRTGDGTIFSIIGSFPQGTQFEVIGIANTGTGWFQVRLPDGRTGFVAPSIVNVTGNTAGLPRVSPPPPPITPTFTPLPATPTPVASADLVAGIVVLTPAQPVCNQTFQIGFDIANFGTQANVTGLVTVTDTHVASGTVTQTTLGPVPVIQPGQTVRVGPIPLTVSTFFNEGHRLTLTIDAGNQIPETNKANNTATVDYTLAQGTCG
jgi:hypothetical protein